MHRHLSKGLDFVEEQYLGSSHLEQCTEGKKKRPNGLRQRQKGSGNISEILEKDGQVLPPS
jgi:hypothetical protein